MIYNINTFNIQNTKGLDKIFSFFVPLISYYQSNRVKVVKQR